MTSPWTGPGNPSAEPDAWNTGAVATVEDQRRARLWKAPRRNVVWVGVGIAAVILLIVAMRVFYLPMGLIGARCYSVFAANSVGQRTRESVLSAVSARGGWGCSATRTRALSTTPPGTSGRVRSGVLPTTSDFLLVATARFARRVAAELAQRRVPV